MTDRHGLLERAALDTEQRDVYDTLLDYTSNKYGDAFKYRDSRGRFLGPFGILLHNPKVAKAYMEMIRHIGGIGEIKPNIREAAILVVGARTGAAYETYAHSPVSGFTREELDTILVGRCPETFDPQQVIAYKVADALCQSGPLDEDLWNQAVKVFGKTSTMCLIHTVAFYHYVAVILNAVNVEIPE